MTHWLSFITYASEYQLFKFLNMKITRTAPDEFNIWLRRAKGCEFTNAELTAILASIDFSVNPDFEGLPLNFIQEVYEALSSAREKMLKHERIKKGLR